MAIKQVSPSYYVSIVILNEMINNVVTTATTATTTTPTMTPSKLQTKDWRKQQPWWKGGKSNECEIVQRKQIETMTGKECRKTIIRINKRTHQMQPLSNPMTRPDGFDLTEDFDGEQQLVGKDGTTYKLLYNFKMVCDSGGAQTRTLREVYAFIEAQQQTLLLGNHHANVRFINILDGDQSHFRKEQFIHLLNLPEYATVKEKVFVDDMVAFKSWFHTRF
jgi:hypothetical protein